MNSLKLNHFKLFFLLSISPFYANSQSERDTTINVNSSENDEFSFFMINASYTNNKLE